MGSAQAKKKRDAGGAASELRVRPADRAGGAARSRGESDRGKRDDDAPANKPRKKRGGGARRSGFGTLIYWGAVLALWAVIAAIGAVIWIGIHLPPI